MKNKVFYYLFMAFIIIILFSGCILAPYNAIFYENNEFQVWVEDDWDLDSEKWFMRYVIRYGDDTKWMESNFFKNMDIEKRDKEIINKYYIDDALCYVVLKAKNETTHYSENPYKIIIWVYGLPNKHTSFTIKNITINSSNGNNLSDLANKELPKTIELWSETKTENKENFIVHGYYDTDEIFNFKIEPINIEFTLDIISFDDIKTGTVVCVLEPYRKIGLFQYITR